MKKRLFGVSTISLLPHSLGRGGFDRSKTIASQAGFDVLQVLPLRGWSVEAWENEKLTGKLLEFVGLNGNWIISYQDAWNGGSLFSAIEREIYQFITRKKCAMEEKPLFYDWFLFGSWKKSS